MILCNFILASSFICFYYYANLVNLSSIKLCANIDLGSIPAIMIFYAYLFGSKISYFYIRSVNLIY